MYGLSGRGLIAAALAAGLSSPAAAIPHQLIRDSLVPAPYAVGTRMKRSRYGSKEGFSTAKRNRSRVRNKIAARSRARNR